MSDSEPDAPPPPKAKATDKQMANLRKGMEALKAKREALAKEKEVFEEKQKKGEIPADAPKPKLAPAPKKPKVVVVSPWTTITSGFSARRIGPRPVSTPTTMSASVCAWRCARNARCAVQMHAGTVQRPGAGVKRFAIMLCAFRLLLERNR